MARLPRLYVPGLPHLLIQRGNNAQTIFADDQDRTNFLQWLREAAREHCVAIHAYALLDDSFVLLGTPREQRAISRMLQSVGRRYVPYFNQRHARAGTLWDGRYRSTVVEPAGFLLDCMRYVESLPQRHGLAADPGGYRWSSGPHHAGLCADPLVTDHALYWALGNTPFERQAAYRQLIDEPLAEPQAQRIHDAMHKGWMLAEPDALAQHAPGASRRPAIAPKGRPRTRKSNIVPT